MGQSNLARRNPSFCTTGSTPTTVVVVFVRFATLLIKTRLSSQPPSESLSYLFLSIFHLTIVLIIMSCSSDPPEHIFAEHTNSGKIFCRKCALFLTDLKQVNPATGVYEAATPFKESESTTTTSTTTSETINRPSCPPEQHNYYQHTKSMRLYCTKCGKFEGALADIQASGLTAVTSMVQKGADSAKKGIQKIKGKFNKSASAASSDDGTGGASGAE